MRLLFVSDSQSSTAVWKKAIECAVDYRVDVLVMAGDHTGKHLVPIIENGKTWTTWLRGKRHVLHTQKEVEAFTQAMQRCGIYTEALSEADVARMRHDKLYFERVFRTAIVNRWTYFGNVLKVENLPGEFRMVVSPGNDDPFYVDSALWQMKSERVSIGTENWLEVMGYTFINFEYCTPTPWNTPRELSDGEIRDRISHLLGGCLPRTKLIFNFHCPPYDTAIDAAPKLDKTLKPVVSGGQTEFQSVGSRSIRSLIESRQPICSLHGHVHESPGRIELGRTQCFNPGSEYENGTLRAYVIEIRNDEVIGNWPVTR